MKTTLSVLLLWSGLLAGCGGGAPAEDTQPVDVADPASIEPAPADPVAEPVEEPSEPVAEAPGGTPCTSSSDCAQGEMCAGPEGCDVEWTCQPARPCTRDLVTYCGCDGQELQGSGSCPPGPYTHRGPC